MLKNRNRLSLFLLTLGLAFVAFLSSCLKDDDNDVATTSNATIYSFRFDAHDSIPGLENVLFTIDQKNGAIFNQDSLPYGADVTQLHPVFTFYDTPSSWIVNDTLHWNGSDSLDFSSPVKFSVWSSDKTTRKDYLITVNVHRTDQAAIHWRQTVPTYDPSFSMNAVNKQVFSYQGKLWMYGVDNSNVVLYWSDDHGLTWNSVQPTGLPASVRLDKIVQFGDKLYTFHSSNGLLYESQDALSWSQTALNTLNGTIYSLIGVVNGRLSGIVKEPTGGLRFFATTDLNEFEYSARYVPNGFPLLFNARTKFETRTGVETLVTGLGYGVEYNRRNNEFLYEGGSKADVWTNILWSSTDGVNWANLTFEQPINDITPNEWDALRDSTTFFGKRLGCAMFAYDHKLYLTGGLPYLSINCLSDLCVSDDGGITWSKVSDNAALPENYRARMNASALVDAFGEITIYGGGTLLESYADFWRGKIGK